MAHTVTLRALERPRRLGLPVSICDLMSACCQGTSSLSGSHAEPLGVGTIHWLQVSIASLSRQAMVLVHEMGCLEDGSA